MKVKNCPWCKKPVGLIAYGDTKTYRVVCNDDENSHKIFGPARSTLRDAVNAWNHKLKT